MAKTVYEDVIDGVPYTVSTAKTVLECCCDCNLVHSVRYRIVDGVLTRQLFRDDRRTSALRRKKGK